MNNNLTDLMNMNMNSTQERPWWAVRPMLLATLTLLVTLLVTLLSRPELLNLAGF
jgi:hypothetical protein